MPITEQDRFVDELRLVAEKIRAMDYQAQAILQAWYGGMNTKIENDGKAIYDTQRADQGIPGISGATVHSLMAILADKKTRMDAVGVRDVVALPCVRALRVE